jgi:hypothetical protein
VLNVGGGAPGGIDRATFGGPGKIAFCFAEDERGSPWESLAVERGFTPEASTVTLFAGHGPSAIIDQISRTPESLVRSLAAKLRAAHHPKLALAMGALLVVSPEHARVFARAGWTKARLRTELEALFMLDGDEVVRGAGGIDEGMPAALAAGQRLPKYRSGDVAIVHAGGHPRGAPMTVVLDPTGERHPTGRARAARPPSLDGRVVGLLDISKPRGDVFLAHLASLLAARGATVRRYTKPTFTKPAPADLKARIARECQVVVEALAD